MVAKREFTIAHSPDADDAFMFYALATGKIESDLLEFRHVLKDIQTLNQDARAGRYDMTAISYHAYPYVSDRYVLTAAGSSVGDGYGPIVVARPGLAPGSLAGSRVAVPGLMTTAYLALKLYEPHIEPVVYDFDAILEAVAGGEVDAGVVIHEGQLTFADTGLRSVVDLGEWWQRTQGLPLPLGCNCILRGLPVQPCRRRLAESFRRRSGTLWTTATRRWNTRFSSHAASRPAWRTASSECTSTVSRQTWRRRSLRRASACLTWDTLRA